jgi:hypothetical protein
LEVAALRFLGDVDHVEHDGRQVVVVEDLAEVEIAREVELREAAPEDRRERDAVLIQAGALRSFGTLLIRANASHAILQGSR